MCGERTAPGSAETDAPIDAGGDTEMVEPKQEANPVEQQAEKINATVGDIAETPPIEPLVIPRVRTRGPARPDGEPSSPTELPVPTAQPSPTSPAPDEDESEDEVLVAPPRRSPPVRQSCGC